MPGPAATPDFVQAHVQDAWQTPDGLLWVTYFDQSQRCETIPMENCSTPMLEVLDPTTGALIASQRLSKGLRPAGTGYLANTQNSRTFDGGRAQIGIYTVRLVRPTSRN
ncbi:MAG: hypothetical protein ABJB74_14150 [Gemmatimonas sp.]